MDWVTDLVTGVGTGISQAFTALWNTVSSSIWDVFLKWVYETIYSAIGDFFTMMGTMGSGLFSLPWVQGYLRLFSLFGWALFLAGLVVSVFDTAIEYQSMGHLNLKQQVMPILYGFLAVNLFTVVPIRLYNLCITLQNVFSHDLAGILGTHMTGITGIGNFAYTVLTTLSGAPNVLNMFFMIALAYCVVKIFFANIKRGGILLIQIAVGSLYMFSIPKGYTDGFIGWCKQIIALCLTAFLQVTLLFLGLVTWQDSIFLAIGVMLSANEVPRIAQNFGLDTSTHVNNMSAVHTTTSVVNLTKAVAGK